MSDGPDASAKEGLQPVALFNSGGGSPFLLLGDHAGNAIPQRLRTLGISAADRDRHIGWDIGVRGLGEALALRLDAVFVHQRYSRLVIDCNRDPRSAEAMPAIADGTDVAGNAALDDTERHRRVEEIHAPYHEAIAREIARRRGFPIIIVALHSFTPVLAGAVRPWDVGVLYWREPVAFAQALLARLRADAALCVGDNAPYAMDDTDHTIPRHAFPARLPYAEIEVRQDRIADAGGQGEWADRLADALRAAARDAGLSGA